MTKSDFEMLTPILVPDVETMVTQTDIIFGTEFCGLVTGQLERNLKVGHFLRSSLMEPWVPVLDGVGFITGSAGELEGGRDVDAVPPARRNVFC